MPGLVFMILVEPADQIKHQSDHMLGDSKTISAGGIGKNSSLWKNSGLYVGVRACGI